MTRTTITAADLKVEDRLDSAGKTRVAQLHVRGERILAKIATRGTRSPSLATYALTDTLNVWR